MTLTARTVRLGAPWAHPRTGEVRYYIDTEDAARMGGLAVERYNTGNICWSELNGEPISHGRAGRILADVRRVYVTEDGICHVVPDGARLEHQAFWSAVKAAVESDVEVEE